MIINNRSITPTQARPVNDAIDAAWSHPHSIETESTACFVELSDGPECFEIKVGGQKWIVHDRRSEFPVFLIRYYEDSMPDGRSRRDNIIIEVAYGKLFDAICEFIPEEERINWWQERRDTMVLGLQVAAAEARDYGNTVMAEKFRNLWTELANGLEPRTKLAE